MQDKGLQQRIKEVVKKLDQLPKEDPEAVDWKNIFNPF